jgi:hypothetical protein
VSSSAISAKDATIYANTLNEESKDSNNKELSNI